MSDYFVKSFNSRLQSPTTEEDSTTGSSSVATAISSGIEEMKTIQNIVNDREAQIQLLQSLASGITPTLAEIENNTSSPSSTAAATATATTQLAALQESIRFTNSNFENGTLNIQKLKF